MSSNEKHEDQSREYKVYVPGIRQFVPVTKEFYYEYYRPIWRTQKQMRKAGRCMCPKGQLWRCDGCCVECRYRAAGNVWSLDYEQAVTGIEREDPGSAIDSIVIDKSILDSLLKRLDALFPEARCIGEMRLEGIPDRDIAEALGIPRSTFRSRLEKINSILQEEYFDLL